MRQLGFERGRNVEYAVRNADGDPARPPSVVGEVLTRVLPKITTLGILLDLGVPSAVRVEQPARAAARTKGLRTITYWARDRALLLYAVDLHALHRQAATLAARILRGANPAELPIEQPTRFKLTLNSTLVRALERAVLVGPRAGFEGG